MKNYLASAFIVLVASSAFAAESSNLAAQCQLDATYNSTGNGSIEMTEMLAGPSTLSLRNDSAVFYLKAQTVAAQVWVSRYPFQGDTHYKFYMTLTSRAEPTLMLGSASAVVNSADRPAGIQSDTVLTTTKDHAESIVNGGIHYDLLGYQVSCKLLTEAP
jgi:hypothetical protein